MAKNHKTPKVEDKESAFELIEMAIDDIDTLTRAFGVISQVCDEANKKNKISNSQTIHDDHVMSAIPESMLN